MTDINLALLDPGLEQFIRREIAKQYNRSSVSTDLVRKDPGIGKNLAWDISVGTGTGQVFDDGQTVSTFNADTEVLATLPWAEYGDAFKITGRAEDAASLSNTELGQTWFFKMNQARERAAKKFNDDLWTGDGTPAPQKLLGFTATNGPFDLTGSYGGQSRITYPQWAGIKLANGGVPRAITLDLIEYGFELVFNASGKVPTYGVTTSNIWRLLASMADGERRKNQETRVRGELISISMGYEFVEVNGVPVFKDISVPTGNLIFFHEPSNVIEYLRTAPSRIARGKIMATTPMAGLPQEQLMMGAPSGGPLVANVISLPSQGNFESWMVVTTAQFRTSRPNANLWIADIAFRAES